MLIERTHGCGELREADVGEEVVVQGWAGAVRDKGGVAFVILRDRSGTVQVTVDEVRIPLDKGCHQAGGPVGALGWTVALVGLQRRRRRLNRGTPR